MRGHSRTMNMRLTHIAGALTTGRITADQLQIRRGRRQHAAQLPTDPEPPTITDLATAFPLRRPPTTPSPPTP